MKKIYNADETAKKDVKHFCVTTQAWPQGKQKRLLGFLLTFIPTISYTVLYSLVLCVPFLHNKDILVVLNELEFIPVCIASIGLIILLNQYCSIQILPKTTNDQLIFIDEGLLYRYVDGRHLCTYKIHYKNINWIMYSSKRKYIVIDCQYVYTSMQNDNENAFVPNEELSVPMVSDVMQNGTVIIPMCFSNIESILTILLRATGISINRDDRQW